MTRVVPLRPNRQPEAGSRLTPVARRRSSVAAAAYPSANMRACCSHTPTRSISPNDGIAVKIRASLVVLPDHARNHRHHVAQRNRHSGLYPVASDA